MGKLSFKGRGRLFYQEEDYGEVDYEITVIIRNEDDKKAEGKIQFVSGSSGKNPIMEKFADLQLEDGSIVKINITKSQHPGSAFIDVHGPIPGI